MRFTKPKRAKIGETRLKLRFAWLPKKTRNGTIIWLERYVSREHYYWWSIPGPGYKGTRQVIGWKKLDCFVWGGKGTDIIPSL